MIYLPYRVCEDCYLLFETLNDIKEYQIEIANLFRIPVDRINFCFNYYTQIKEDKTKVKLTQRELYNIDRLNSEISNMNLNDEYQENNNTDFEYNSGPKRRKETGVVENEEMHNESNTIEEQKKNYFNNNLSNNNNALEEDQIKIKDNNAEKAQRSKKKTLLKNYSTGMNPDFLEKEKQKMNLMNNRQSLDENNLTKSAEIKKPLNLYQILIMFNDIIWNDIAQIPIEDLYIVYTDHNKDSDGQEKVFAGIYDKENELLNPIENKEDYVIIENILSSIDSKK
jgi:hypothetical protein